jgi:hypothetical protein
MAAAFAPRSIKRLHRTVILQRLVLKRLLHFALAGAARAAVVLMPAAPPAMAQQVEMETPLDRPIASDTTTWSRGSRHVRLFDIPISEPSTDRVLNGGSPAPVDQQIPSSTLISGFFSPTR